MHLSSWSPSADADPCCPRWLWQRPGSGDGSPPAYAAAPRRRSESCTTAPSVPKAEKNQHQQIIVRHREQLQAHDASSQRGQAVGQSSGCGLRRTHLASWAYAVDQSSRRRSGQRAMGSPLSGRVGQPPGVPLRLATLYFGSERFGEDFWRIAPPESVFWASRGRVRACQFNRCPTTDLHRRWRGHSRPRRTQQPARPALPSVTTRTVQETGAGGCLEFDQASSRASPSRAKVHPVVLLRLGARGTRRGASAARKNTRSS